MKKKDKVLEIALRKCKYMERNEWGGYLTPSETLKLYSIGLSCSEWSIIWTRNRMNEGIGNPSWFYFHPHKVLREMLEKIYNSQGE
jgi:hypothetical protein